MQKRIFLHGLIVNKNRVEYIYSVCDKLVKYFNTKERYFLEYDFDITDVPESLLIVPFVCNVLPIAWITDSEIVCDEIDKAFWESIPQFKNGYIKMYPFMDFKGKIVANKIVENHFIDRKNNPQSMLFFSGGVDANCSLITHLKEKPILFTIWGSDVSVNDKDGWELVKRNLVETSERYGVLSHSVKSTFRTVINESELDQLVKTYDSRLVYWHEFQHGISIISHAVAVCWKYSLSKVYIASSNTPEDEGKIWCASHPTIDNNVKFADSDVYNDCYELNRQDKINKIVNYSKEIKQGVQLHVCWGNVGGKNCCKCEKCYRTITGLLVEGEPPLDYGFEFKEDQINEITEFVKKQKTIEKDWRFIIHKARMINSNQRFQKLLELDIDRWEQIGDLIINPFYREDAEEKKSLHRMIRQGIRKNKIVIWGYNKFFSLIEEIKCRKVIISKYKKVNGKKKIVLMNTPTHDNIGDAAIALAELKFFKKFLPEYSVVEVDGNEIRSYFELWKKLILPDDIIAIHGGGYLGTLWPDENKIAMRILREFRNNQIIIMPQTFYYEESENGKDFLKEDLDSYKMKADKISVFLRDEVSYNRFQKAAPFLNSVYVMPDIVLSMNKCEKEFPRAGIIACMRQDLEKSSNHEYMGLIVNFCKENNMDLRLTEMSCHRNIYPEERVDSVALKLEEFSRAEFVVTDRLHAMIFCALTGTPCLATDNLSHKVSGGYEWISALPYIKFLKENENLQEKLSDMKSLCKEVYHYDESLLNAYYVQLAEYINTIGNLK